MIIAQDDVGLPAAANEGRNHARRGDGLATLLLVGTLVVLSIIGVLTPSGFNRAPAEWALEGVFLLIVGWAAVTNRRAALGFVGVALLYVVGKYLLMRVMEPASLWDFVQAYKAYLYLPAFGFLLGARLFDRSRVARLCQWLLIAFAVKYGYSIFFGITTRPGIFLENNFELTLLLGLFYLAYPALGGLRSVQFGLLAAVVIASGSRSAALGLLVVYVALFMRWRSRWLMLHLIGLSAVGYAVVFVFTERMAGQTLTSLDRFRFLQVFLNETSDWHWWQFLVGSPPLSPLSTSSCHYLGYYTRLFSESNSGTCYSVIMHSFELRVMFDQGLLGAAFLYLAVWYVLRRATVPAGEAVTVLVLATVNGLSVSAFNSVFVILVVAICVALVRDGDAAAGAAPAVPIRDRRADRAHRGGRL